jgi:2'-5' RNA ligase
MNLIENASKSNNEFGCLMGFVSEPVSKKLIKFAHDIIPQNTVYTEPDDDSYSYERDPHITLLYGFVNILSTDNLKMILKGVKPFNVIAKSLSIFDSEKFDVVKFDIEVSPLLTELHKRCEKFPNKNDFPKYHPHLTLCYVKKGTFPHKKENLEIVVPITKFVYSRQDGKKITINL